MIANCIGTQDGVRKGCWRAPPVLSGGLIDLHFHALPGLDDGPRSLSEALDLCAAAAADGTAVVTATPHINFRYPDIDGDTVHTAVGELRAALAQSGIPIDLRTGGEVALVRAMDSSDDELRALTLDGGPTLLLELPWAATGTGIAAAVSRIARRGFTTLLAHPERTPMLRDDIGLVRTLVDRGSWCCLNAGSLSPGASPGTRRAARRLMGGGLIHAIVSDAHGTAGRGPEVRSILRGLGFSTAEITYYTESGPRALLTGSAPGRPPAVSGRRRLRLSVRSG